MKDSNLINIFSDTVTCQSYYKSLRSDSTTVSNFKLSGFLLGCVGCGCVLV